MKNNSLIVNLKKISILVALVFLFFLTDKIALAQNFNSQQQKDIAFENLRYVYYAQCGKDYGQISLPSGCNLCQAGCGPTTVAMVLSSYLNTQFTPAKVIDLYKNNGFYLGCNGSYFSNAKIILEQNGLKTTDLMFYPGVSADNAAFISDIRSYIKLGKWTLLALASFAEPDPACNRCHIFWITDIDDKNNIIAYDPYYGMFQIPYNENTNFPLPKYKIAFGVKKK